MQQDKREHAQASHSAKHQNEIEYPLRLPGDWRRCMIRLAILPAFVTVGLAFACTSLLCPDIHLSKLLTLSIYHFGALLLFLFLLWVPLALAIFDLTERVEMAFVMIRSGLLALAVSALFPYTLVSELLQLDKPENPLGPLYVPFVALLILGYLFLSYLNNQRTAIRDVRKAAGPQGRKHPDRWLWFDALSVFLTLIAVMVLELWFAAALCKGGPDFGLSREWARLPDEPTVKSSPSESPQERLREDSTQTIPQTTAGLTDSSGASLFQSKSDTMRTSESPALRATPDSSMAMAGQKTLMPQDTLAALPVKTSEQIRADRMHDLSLWCCSILCALIFFTLAGLPYRLMKAILIPVTFHERDVQGMVFKSHRYLYHFFWAMLLRYPFLFAGGMVLLLVFLSVPAVLFSSGRIDFLANLVAPDEVILVLGVFVAWFSPLALSVVMPDQTFGEYFSQRVANQIMMVQGHIVFIGYGSLGARVLNREIARTRPQPVKTGRAWWQVWKKKLKRMKKKPKRMFFDIVTPDLRLERLCSYIVVIERDPRDVIYSDRNALLGDFGVVSADKHIYRSRDTRGQIIHPEKRVLVPVVIGEAREPFVSSRVNLERANLIISMVPEEESVQTIFERANKAGVSAIICVTRSDQISYLTYRTRHRPIVLVYPKHNQGITLGNRLWAAMLKLRAIRGITGEVWPRILVIGNNKANHYMLETLWTNLPGKHKERSEILRNNLAFVVTAAEDEQAYPMLRESNSKEVFDLHWPATYVTGGRYPYPASQVSSDDVLGVPTRVVNAADILALEACINKHRPDIMVINHEEVTQSLLMLSRCVRALERIKTSQSDQFKLPLLLMAAARGDEWEELSMGDASRFYNALCLMHKEEVARDVSYPEHASYQHRQRKLIGESISDSHADSEEIIAGARNVFLDPKNPRLVEINACLPNRPGTLATYIARLAGLRFQGKSKEELDQWWQQCNTLPSEHAALLPSFQYLRNIMLDPERTGFALTGYATLAPVIKDIPSGSTEDQDAPLVVRVFANDSRNYVEPEKDEDELPDGSSPQWIEEPSPPGVPQVIDWVGGREPGSYNTVGQFHEVMMDPQPPGDYSCPGMNICRIAAFQDYVIASNHKRLERFAASSDDPAHRDAKLLHARNYYCCSGMQRAIPLEIPSPSSPYARMFVCCKGTHDPGMIATVLNTLLFRTRIVIPVDEQRKDKMVINIDYFKDISCQNSHFTLNRLFGFFKEPPRGGGAQNIMPMHLLRILPIGGVASARQWYYYAKALHRFLNTFDKGRAYKFYWVDEQQVTHEKLEDVPQFDAANRSSFPAVLVIKLERGPEGKQAKKVSQVEMCDLCHIQPKEYDCRRLRLWV